MRYFQSQKHTGCTTEAINNCLNCMYYSCLPLLTMLNIAHSCFHFSIYGENTLYNPNGKLTQMNFWARLLTISEMQYIKDQLKQEAEEKENAAKESQ